MTLGDFLHRLLVYHVMEEKQPVCNCILYFIQYYVSHSIHSALKINVSNFFVFDVFYLSLTSFKHSIIKVLISKWAT